MVKIEFFIGKLTGTRGKIFFSKSFVIDKKGQGSIKTQYTIVEDNEIWGFTSGLPR